VDNVRTLEVKHDTHPDRQADFVREFDSHAIATRREITHPPPPLLGRDGDLQLTRCRWKQKFRYQG
jgi:hypothetical protein